MIIFIRGVPGTGKTTLAERIFRAWRIPYVEADQYMSRFGEFHFDPRLLSEAHDWCRNTAFAFRSTYGHVVVSNTFVRMWEMQQYFTNDWIKNQPAVVLEFSNKNLYGSIHGVPDQKIQGMVERWEPITPALKKAWNAKVIKADDHEMALGMLQELL